MNSVCATLVVEHNFGGGTVQEIKEAFDTLKILTQSLREYQIMPAIINQIYCPAHEFKDWFFINFPGNIFRDSIGRLYYALPIEGFLTFANNRDINQIFAEVDPVGYGAVYETVAEVTKAIAQQEAIIEVAKEIVKFEDAQITFGRFCLMAGVIAGCYIVTGVYLGLF